MGKDQSTAADKMTAAVTIADIVPERQTYKVLNPLYKRGREWKKGSTIDLDERTAAAFLHTGDIKETK